MQNKIEVKFSPEFKLKDKVGRNEIGIDFMKEVGYLPDMIVIEKVKGQNNVLRLGIFPKDYLAKKKRVDARAKRAEKVSKEREAKKNGKKVKN